MQRKEIETYVADETKALYGKRLVSCAVFGSIARGVHTPESDTDLFLVVRDLPRGRMARVSEFSTVEERVEKSLGCDPLLSPVIKTPDEAKAGSPLLWDMIDYADILHDEEGFLADLLATTRRRLESLGAYRVQKGNAWYWVLKKDYKPGEVFEL